MELNVAARRARLRAVGILSAGFVLITVLVMAARAPIQSFDTAVGTPFIDYTREHDWLLGFMNTVAFLFNSGPMTAYTVITAGILLWKKQRAVALWVVLSMVLSTLAQVILKPILGRARPVWDEPVAMLSSLSYPSGHSTGVASAAVIATTLVYTFTASPHARRTALAISTFFVVLVGLDRLFLGLHNITDVFAGWMLGAGVALALAAWLVPAPAQAQATTTSTPV